MFLNTTVVSKEVDITTHPYSDSEGLVNDGFIIDGDDSEVVFSLEESLDTAGIQILVNISIQDLNKPLTAEFLRKLADHLDEQRG